MKFQLASDIHLEFGHTVSIDNIGTDVLVLAGDICCARDFKTDFFRECANKFKHVVYIMGNHEHYKHLFNDTADVIRENLSGLSNVHFLDNDSVVLDGMKFVGATLWTDMNKGNPLTKNQLAFGMNDFRLIKYRDPKDNYFSFTPTTAYFEHHKTLAFLKEEIAKGDPCVVITHHAPSMQSIHPKYADDVHMNGGYASDLEDLMDENVKVWCHGHTHTPFNYLVDKTLVVCNPFGYPGERDDVKSMIVEV